MSEFEFTRRKSKMNDFDFFYGGYFNWVDLNTNTTYFIREYHEAIDKGEKPKGIRYQTIDSDVGYLPEATLRQLIKDPPPDPKYTAETPEEHRRSRA